MNQQQVQVGNERQVVNVDKAEIKLIKSTFKDQDDLLKAMRAVMLGLKITDDQKKWVKDTFSNPQIMAAVRKRFLPTIDPEAPIGQISDSWLGVEQMVFGAHSDQRQQAVQYRARAHDMMEQGLHLLQDPDAFEISVEFSPVASEVTDDELQVSLLSRNQYIRHIESQLLFLKVVAAQPDEEEDNPQEAAERREKDSVR